MTLKHRDISRLIALVSPLEAHLSKAIVDIDEIGDKRTLASAEEQAEIDRFLPPAALATLRGRLVTARDVITARVDVLQEMAAA